MAFHPYPQLIRAVFNPQRFGPPPGVTPASTWPWIDRVGFGSAPTYSSRPFQTRFRFGSGPEGLNLAREEQLAGSLCKRHAVTHEHAVARPRLLPLVCTRFQGLFHSPSGVLFTFPSRYSALSVTSSYLALEDGPPRFNRDFSCPGLLGYLSASLLCFRIRDSHPLWSAVPGAFR